MLIRIPHVSSKLAFRRLDPDTPISISGVVRLASKYLMDSPSPSLLLSSLSF